MSQPFSQSIVAGEVTLQLMSFSCFNSLLPSKIAQRNKLFRLACLKGLADEGGLADNPNSKESFIMGEP